MQPTQPTSWYGKDAARFISGVAILLMIAHHFFGFKEYLRSDVNWIPLCKVAGIEKKRVGSPIWENSVWLCCFQSGYGFWCRQGDFKRQKRSFGLLNFLIGYWMVCGLFLLYALAVGDNLPSMQQLLLNLVGLGTGPFQSWVNVTFAWYVAYYIAFILLAPLLLAIFKSRHLWIDIAGWVGIVIFSHLTDKILPNVLSPLPIGAFGILAAKWTVFERMNKHLSHLHAVVFACMIPVIVGLRQGFILIFLNTPVYILMGGSNLCVSPYSSSRS